MVRAQKRVGGIVAKFTLLSFLTVMSFFALPFHNGPYHLPAWHGFDLKPSELMQNAQPSEPSVFDQELAMSSSELLARWTPYIEEASQRFGLPESWIRAVIGRESGGRTMMAENTPITSQAGAVGVMQVMPETYDEMRAQYALGNDATDPHDNIIAGAAYLSWLYRHYGFPDMFAAYNDGPGNFDKYKADGRALPVETVNYLAAMRAQLDPPRRKNRSRSA